MRKLLLGTAAALALSAGPVWADVMTHADIDKERDKLVFELVVKIKLAAVIVLVQDRPEKFAESEVVVNQRNQDNSACENCSEKEDLLRNSGSDNSGITSINQSAGSMNNQGTAIAFSIDVGGGVPDLPPGEGSGFAEAVAQAEQINFANDVDTINILFRNAIIDTSGNDNTGVLYVNQAAGNINNQTNALSVAVSLVPGIALADSYLGQYNTGNTVDEVNDATDGPGFVNKLAAIGGTGDGVGSFNRNMGILGVNQTAGNMANQANVVSLATAIAVGP